MAERRPLPRLVIFDLDGTLVDTVPDIAVALNAALADCNLPAVTESETRRWVGNGAGALCDRAIARGTIGGAQPALAQVLLQRFLLRYAERACVDSRIYDGVRETLDWLMQQGCRLACVTNKPLAHTGMLLDALDLRRHFALVFGGDSLPQRKPHLLPLLECLERLDVDSREALMVGDSQNDVDAAHAAGIDCACVSYGYSQGRDVREFRAALVLDAFPELRRHFGEARA